jgi:pimeloyl-ACP methyl ester carboxylesterase
VRALELPGGKGFLRYIEIDGGGPVRVYLHGLGFSSGSLAHIAAHPALTGRRSLLVDLLGFGLSDKPDDFGYTIEDHAATIACLLDKREMRGCELIGHSLGGSIAIVLASTHPDLVSSLVVAEANLDPGVGPVSARILAMSEQEYVQSGCERLLRQAQADARRDPEQLSAITVGMQAVASPCAMYRTARSLTQQRRPTFRELLAGQGIARSFLVGSNTLDADESPASGEDGEELEGAGIQRLIVPNAGHLMPLENPDGFARTVSRALTTTG